MLKGRKKKRHNRRKNNEEIARGRKYGRREWNTGKERWKETRKNGGTKGEKSRKWREKLDIKK
jgi:hypothetical protein